MVLEQHFTAFKPLAQYPKLMLIYRAIGATVLKNNRREPLLFSVTWVRTMRSSKIRVFTSRRETR